jgi:Leucine-rich repeat (LRR) protein
MMMMAYNIFALFCTFLAVNTLTSLAEQVYPKCNTRLDDASGNVTADCAGLNLTSVPTNLPYDVTTLNLSRNVIDDVTTDAPLRRLGRLRHLDLSFNRLVEIDWSAFPDSLDILDLSYNNIADVCIDGK